MQYENPREIPVEKYKDHSRDLFKFNIDLNAVLKPRDIDWIYY